MRKRYSRSYTVLSFLTMFSYRELPFGFSFFDVPFSTIRDRRYPVLYLLRSFFVFFQLICTIIK